MRKTAYSDSGQHIVVVRLLTLYETLEDADVGNLIGVMQCKDVDLHGVDLRDLCESDLVAFRPAPTFWDGSERVTETDIELNRCQTRQE